MSLEIFEEQIRSIEELQHLFFDDPEREYYCSPNIRSSKFPHIHKCVMKTSKYPFLNQYIDIYLSLNPQVIDEQNEKGWTALMLSARNSRTDSSEKTVKLLLEHGAKVNIQKNDGWTALMLSAGNSRTHSSEETVKLLLEHGAKVNIQDKNGTTALMISAIYSRTDSSEETVKLLLEHGTDVDIQNKKGLTALMLAARNSKTDSSEKTVKLLLDHGANIDIQEEGGQTALMMTVRHPRTYSTKETVKLLLEHGANVEIQEQDGLTALMYAAWNSRTDSSEEIVKLLLEYRSNIHHTTVNDWNVLRISLISKSSICIGIIIASHIMKNTVVNISEEERKYIINLFQSMKEDEKNKVIEAFQNNLEIEYAEEEIIRNRSNFIKLKDNVNVTLINCPRITKSKLYDFKFIRNFQMKTIRDLFFNF